MKGFSLPPSLEPLLRLSVAALLDYSLDAPADLLFAIEVAQLPDQRLVTDLLATTGVGPLSPVAGEEGIGRRTWAHGSGRFTAHYTATVDVERAPVVLEGLAASPVLGLPAEVSRYLWPSRYCEADRFEAFVVRTFGHLAGGDKVQAIADWIAGHVEYFPGITTTTTTAGDAFLQRQGVCRDFAHLLIAMVRAADIPARMVGAYGLGVDPPDFHAVAEVWLAGAWHLVDASRLAEPTGLIRVCVGRDATDIGFLTIFGRGVLMEQRVAVTRVS